MVETISPVVHGARGRWRAAVGLHAAGAVLTSALLGAALGWVGRALGAPWGAAGTAAVAVTAVAYGLSELGGVRVPVPALRRQVPDWWRTFFGRRVASGLYGATLGIGFLTYLAHGTLVVVCVAAVASGRPGLGALVMAPFGLVRGLSPLASRRVRTRDDGRALVDRLADAPTDRRRLANGLAMAGVTAIACAASIARPEGEWWRLAAALLAAAFAWASASKLASSRRWRRALAEHGLPVAVERVAWWAVPASEGIVAVLAIAGRPRWAAGWSVALLVVLTVEAVRVSVRSGPRVPCGCFGSRTSTDVRVLVARNLGLGGLAAFVLARGRDAAWSAWPGEPAGADVLPAALAGVGLVVVLATAWRSAAWLRRGPRA